MRFTHSFTCALHVLQTIPAKHNSIMYHNGVFALVTYLKLKPISQKRHIVGNNLVNSEST